MEREAICPKCAACYRVREVSPGRQFRCGMCRTVFTFQESGPTLPLEPHQASPAPALSPRRKRPFRIAAAAAVVVVITLVAMEYRSNVEARKRAEASEKQAISGEARARRALVEVAAEQARLIAERRKTARAIVGAGRVALDHGRWDEALECLNSALTLDPSQAGARFLKGAAFAAQKNYERAAAELGACADADARALREACRKVLAGEVAPEAASRVFAGIFMRRKEPALAAPHLRDVEARAEAYRELLSQSLPVWRDDALMVSGHGELRLDLTACGIHDLTPLKDLLLDELVLDGNPVGDLWALREMPLRSLSLCDADALDDLSPLSGMPLEELQVVSCRSIKDLSALRGLPLKRLSLSRTPVADLSPLKAMGLERLNVSETLVSDLGPLEGLSLQTLLVEATSVRDLRPLRGMPLGYLSLDFTAIDDLSPIRGAPLRYVSLLRTPVKDVSALEGMPLEVLRFEPRDVMAGVELVRAMPTLMTVSSLETGAIPAVEFWIRYDGLR